MPKFAANLSMMFNEVPFLERFDAAAAAGFQAVEFLFPYEFSPTEVAARLHGAGLRQALFNTPPGDWDAGERGLAAVPGREDEFLAGVDRTLEYARALDCPCLHAMAGILPKGVDRDEALQTYVSNLRAACDRLAQEDRTLVIEPINSRDMPGYFLSRSAQALRTIQAVNRPNMGLLLDLYHCQIMEGDLAVHIRHLKDVTRHIQIAGVPERHEPDIGEINYPYVFEVIDSTGYDGWIGCEYRPRAKTTLGLGWLYAEVHE